MEENDDEEATTGTIEDPCINERGGDGGQHEHNELRERDWPEEWGEKPGEVIQANERSKNECPPDWAVSLLKPWSAKPRQLH